MAELTFGQIEAVLAEANGIATDKRVAFSSRLKHLQGYGLPIRERLGRGKAAKYSFVHLLQMAAGLEIVQVGLSPQSATAIVKRNWQDMLLTIASARFHETEGATDEQKKIMAEADYWMMMPEALSDLTGERDDFDRSKNFMVTGEIGLVENLNIGGRYINAGAGRRAVVINGTSLVRSVIDITCKIFNFCTIDQALADVSEDFSVRFDQKEQLADVIELEFGDADHMMDLPSWHRTLQAILDANGVVPDQELTAAIYRKAEIGIEALDAVMAHEQVDGATIGVKPRTLADMYIEMDLVETCNGRWHLSAIGMALLNICEDRRNTKETTR